jgi:hypothetical protein
MTAKKTKTNMFNRTDPIPSSFEKVADMTIESAYTSDWEIVQGELFEGEDAFEHIVYLNSKQQRTAHQPSIEYMGGRYYNRNQKNIDRVTINTPKSGDKARYPIVTGSRHRICFPVELDSLMSIQVNKSKIQEELIHPAIKRVCDALVRIFIDQHYNPEDQSEQEVMTKPEAMEIVNRLVSHFDEHPEQKQNHIDAMIDVIVKMPGKCKRD